MTAYPDHRDLFVGRRPISVVVLCEPCGFIHRPDEHGIPWTIPEPQADGDDGSRLTPE